MVPRVPSSRGGGSPSERAAHDGLLHMPSVKLTRRDFLKLSAASAALAAGACSPPAEPIVPYAAQTESTLPGVPRFYATTASFTTAAEWLLVESNTARPTNGG